MRAFSNGNPCPEVFPLGSTESRAAARALLEAREERIKIQIICIGRQASDPPLPAPECLKYPGGVIEILYAGWDTSRSEQESPPGNDGLPRT